MCAISLYIHNKALLIEIPGFEKLSKIQMIGTPADMIVNGLEFDESVVNDMTEEANEALSPADREENLAKIANRVKTVSEPLQYPLKLSIRSKFWMTPAKGRSYWC